MNKPILKLESKPSLQATHWLDLSIETKKDDDRHRANEEHERAVEEAIDAIDHAAYDHGCIEALGGHDTRELVRRRFAACDAMRALMRRQPKETT